jgi:hypothetical protein
MATQLNIQALLGQIEAAQKQANDAGLERYQNLLNAVSGTKNSVLGAFGAAEGNLAGMGNSEVARIAQDRARQLAGSDQALISRGLGNTTVRNAARRGIVSDSSRAMSDVAERVATAKAGLNTQKAGALGDLGRLEADSILSRQDIGPPTDLYASLIQQLMANQATAAASNPGRSYNFVGGVPRGPSFGQSIGPSMSYESPGVQSFTNPDAQPGVTRAIRRFGSPGVASYSRGSSSMPSYGMGGVQTFTRYS